MSSKNHTDNRETPPFPFAEQTITEPLWVRRLLISFALGFLALFLFLPLAFMLFEAFAKGVSYYFKALSDEDAVHALFLTLFSAAVAVPVNIAFGLAAAWCVAKFEFPGKSILITLIDLPFAISPVVAGLLFVLLFGLQGWFGAFLESHHFKIIYAVPGVILATLFVTFPFVARELIPVMQLQGTEEEFAARVLGANGLQIFWRVTLPNIKWGLLYGVILCNARAMGEFGAVAVVSGSIRKTTCTLPLHIENLYNENLYSAAFAVASLLAALAIVTLAAKTMIEMKTAKEDKFE
ncbi:MAG: sulfate ABC transporter permease subunit CysW [Planctomycetaceae bacterium]|jgi:sulfate transport system permease protein|nr:sulfate ABC transporter permease subunit CysW [Planctomycetaceae bacterium]